MDDASRPKKKRKFSGAGGATLLRKRKKSKTLESKPAKRVTHVDALPWRSVDVPEMFDDAEGFYGLEEVEGVDVIRTGDTVQFVSSVVPLHAIVVSQL